MMKDGGEESEDEIIFGRREGEETYGSGFAARVFANEEEEKNAFCTQESCRRY